MPSLYHYLYTSIFRVKEFNSIITNNVNEKNFSVNINRFKTAKNVIFIDFINKQIIGIAFDRAIIIGLVMSKLETIARRKEIELFGLLRRLETGIISRRELKYINSLLNVYFY